MGLGLGLGLGLGRLGRDTLLDLLTTHVGREGPGVADMVQRLQLFKEEQEERS